jgi:hypothetical protein
MYTVSQAHGEGVMWQGNGKSEVWAVEYSPAMDVFEAAAFYGDFAEERAREYAEMRNKSLTIAPRWSMSRILLGILRRKVA